jgi:hypothetical protein
MLILPGAAALAWVGDQAALGSNDRKFRRPLPRRCPRTPLSSISTPLSAPAILYLPAKIPRDIVIRFHQETAKALRASAVQERLAQLGVMPMNLDQSGEYFREDVEANARLVQIPGIQTQQ